MSITRQSYLGLVCGVILLVSAGAQAASQDHLINLEPPGPREFVLDRAGVINKADKKQIVQICDKLLTDKATPIIVVTIESMQKYFGRPTRIESFALLLFNQWQVGQAKLHGKNWNTGILLLVSMQDHKARIELGAGWGHDKDQECQKIMDEQIVPRFKEGKFSAGILAGVQSLDKMARGLQLPRAYRPWWYYALIAGFIGLAIFTIVSLIRRGASGWAWLFWGAIFAFIGYMLYQSLQSRGGGGFSGGSFGGGFSGGGGATGSW